MLLDIPGHKTIEINTLILDLNGTLSVAGKVDSYSKAKLRAISEMGIETILFTGDTRGDAEQLCSDLGISWRKASSAEEKASLAQAYNPTKCATIGNGRIDLELFKVCALRICTIQAEGVHIDTLLNSDIIVTSFLDALDLFIDPNRIVATLRS
jgi:soluble P-type ATPase